jgi:hypothetical protein
MTEPNYTTEGPITGDRAARRAGPSPVVWIALIMLSPLLATILILLILAMILHAVLLHVALWMVWGLTGRRVLFVYSNSPIWQSYVEQRIVPRLPRGSVILNWSERRQWRRWSLATAAFRYFGGSREFNPLAVVVRPLRWGRTFRFWQPFRDYKHGNDQALQRTEAELFAYLEERQRNRAV